MPDGPGQALSGRIAVDIGGTFTDVVLARSDGRLFVCKLSSTTHEPEKAVITGVSSIMRLAEVGPADVLEVLHGTTIGSNTILQKAGAVTARRPSAPTSIRSPSPWSRMHSIPLSTTWPTR